jgi:hypothetical protein
MYKLRKSGHNYHLISNTYDRTVVKEIRGNYTCPRCQIINSTYDLECRMCGEKPSCNYIAKHKQEIEKYLTNR